MNCRPIDLGSIQDLVLEAFYVYGGTKGTLKCFCSLKIFRNPRKTLKKLEKIPRTDKNVSSKKENYEFNKVKV